jgi:hypothetical protein
MINLLSMRKESPANPVRFIDRLREEYPHLDDEWLALFDDSFPELEPF